MVPVRSRGLPGPANTAWRQEQQLQELAAAIWEMPSRDTLAAYIVSRLDVILSSIPPAAPSSSPLGPSQQPLASGGSSQGRGCCSEEDEEEGDEERSIGDGGSQASAADSAESAGHARVLHHLQALLQELTVTWSHQPPAGPPAPTQLPHPPSFPPATALLHRPQLHPAALFSASFLHALLALAWAPARRHLPGSCVDNLAAASTWLLPTPLYAAALEAMGMEHLLLELLGTAIGPPHPPTVPPHQQYSGTPGAPSPHLLLLAELLDCRPALAVGFLAALCPDASPRPKVPCPSTAHAAGDEAVAESVAEETAEGPLLLLLATALARSCAADDLPTPAAPSHAPAGSAATAAAALAAAAAAVQQLRCLLSLCLAATWCARRLATPSPSPPQLTPAPSPLPHTPPTLLVHTQVLQLMSVHTSQPHTSPWAQVPLQQLLSGCLTALEALLCNWQDSCLAAAAAASAPRALHPEPSIHAEARLLLREVLRQLAGLGALLDSAMQRQQQAPSAAAALDVMSVIRLKCRVLLFQGAAGAVGPGPTQTSASGSGAAGHSLPGPIGFRFSPSSWVSSPLLQEELCGPSGGNGAGGGPGAADAGGDAYLQGVCSDPFNPSPAGGLQAASAFSQQQWGAPAGAASAPCASWLQLPVSRVASQPRAASVIQKLAATAVATAAAGPGGGRNLAAPLAPFPAWALGPVAVGSPAAAWSQRLAGLAAALLTPGMPCWWPSLTSGAVQYCLGANSYCPMACTLAALELAAGAMQLMAGTSGGCRGSSRGAGAGGGRGLGLGLGLQGELVPLLLHMAAAAAAQVKQCKQQAALQQAVLEHRQLTSLVALCSEDPALRSSAGRRIVSLANRMVSVQELDRTAGVAVSRAALREAAAEAAATLLPLALLAPAPLLGRLVTDAVHHSGQQPLALELLHAFAPVARNPPGSREEGAALPSALVLAVRRLILPPQSAPGPGPEALDVPSASGGHQLHLSAGDCASLLLLCGSLAEGGLMSRAEQMQQVVMPVLQARLEGSAGRMQAHAALTWATQALELLPPAPPPPPPPSLGPGLSPAARPATLRSPPHVAGLVQQVGERQLLLLLGQLLDSFWADLEEQGVLDAGGMDLCEGLVEWVVRVVRAEAVGRWEEVTRAVRRRDWRLKLHAALGQEEEEEEEEEEEGEEGGDGGVGEGADGGAAGDLALELLLLLKEAAGKLRRPSLLRLLPALELALALRPPGALRSGLMDRLLPAALWRGPARARGRAGAAAGTAQGGGDPVQSRATEALQWGMSAEAHCQQLVGELLRRDREAEEGEGTELELSGASRGVVGTLQRVLFQEGQGGRVMEALGPALALALPGSSAAGAARLLDAVLPAVVCSCSLGDEGEDEGQGTVRTWLQGWAGGGAGSEAADARKALAAALMSPSSDSRSEAPPQSTLGGAPPLPGGPCTAAYCLHLVFSSTSAALVGRLEEWGRGQGQGGAAGGAPAAHQAVVDRCFAHVSSHVQRLMGAVGGSSGGAATGGGAAAGAAAGGALALALVALEEGVACLQRIAAGADPSAVGGSWDPNTLQVLLLSLVRTLCMPHLHGPGGALAPNPRRPPAALAAAALCVSGLSPSTPYLSLLAAVAGAVGGLSAYPGQRDQLLTVAQQAVDDHMQALGLPELDIALFQ